MNEIFKNFKSDRIDLGEGYYLESDQFKGLVLIRETEKIRKKKDVI